MFERIFVNAALACVIEQDIDVFAWIFKKTIGELIFFFLLFGAIICHTRFEILSKWDGQSREVDSIAVFAEECVQFGVEFPAMRAVETRDFDDVDLILDIERANELGDGIGVSGDFGGRRRKSGFLCAKGDRATSNGEI